MVGANERVYYIDFGETAFDTAWVAANVAKREWETKQVLIRTLDPDDQEYCKQSLRDRLSGDNFETHWCTDLTDLDRDIIAPPHLSERPEDIPGLVERILERANQEKGWSIDGVSSDVLDLFKRYAWIGSDDRVTPDLLDLIRWRGWTGGGAELQNVLYNAAATCRGKIIQMNDIPRYIEALSE